MRSARKYPDKYWRELEDNDEYADAFVTELSAAGYLGALIPEQYGGAGLPIRAGCVILEEIHASGCSAAPCRAQMYMMGTLLRHGSEAQKQRYLPGIAAGDIRFQAFGVTEPTTGSDTTQLKTRAVRDGEHYVVNGQKVWTSRAHKSDLMLLLVRTTPADQVKRRSDGLSVLLVEMREALGKGLTLRRLDTMVNHQTNEVFFDNLKVPVENLIGEQDQGFRYILDGMNAERILVSGESSAMPATSSSGLVLFEGARRVRPPDRPESGASNSRSRAPTPSGRPPTCSRAPPPRCSMPASPAARRRISRSSWPRRRPGMPRRRACRRSAALPPRASSASSESGGKPALADRADLDQSHSCLYRSERARHAEVVLSETD